MTEDNYKLVDEQVGLLGAVALLAGTALGMSIFIVPTQMMVQAGPSIVLAILLSILPMILGVLLLLQLGGAMPVAGGIYVYCSRLLGPTWGVLGIAIPVCSVWAYLLFAAMGFSEYLAGLGVGVHQLVVVWAILGAFLLINFVGIRIVLTVQYVMVALLLAALLTFIVGAALSFDPANVGGGAYDGGLFPDNLFEGDGVLGYAPFFFAVVLLYIPFQGFGMIIEIGEELENPIENIPRVLAIGMSLVTVVSIALVLALVGAVHWEQVVQDPAAEQPVPVEGGLATVAGDNALLPGLGVLFVAIGALIAAATTINTLITSYSRTIMRAARDDLVPDRFASIHERFSTPTNAILGICLPPILLAPVVEFGDVFFEYRDVDPLDWLVVVVVSGIFVVFVMGGVALWNLPKRYPDRYEFSFYRLPMPVLKVVAVGNVVVSFVFMVMVVLSAPTGLAVIVGWGLLCLVAFKFRSRRLAKEGTSLEEEMSVLDSHE